MSTPSSSSREFVSANASPERNGSSSASGSGWHSAQEHLEMSPSNFFDLLPL
ncbi:MAG: hypothetical protein Q9228_004917, partial [Teloschistes exilis]